MPCTADGSCRTGGDDVRFATGQNGGHAELHQVRGKRILAHAADTHNGGLAATWVIS